MKLFLKIVFCFTIFSIVWLAPVSEAAMILKTKNKQALIHLEGIKTKKGSFFEVIDLYGKKKGLVQIKRVGEKKAIGIVRLGRIGKRWSLEPFSKGRAVAKIQKRKQSLKMARIQKEKLKRKLALRRQLALKRKLALKKRLAQRRRASRRSLASYEEDSEYILDDLPEDHSYQSKEVLSYEEPPPSAPPEDFSLKNDQLHSDYEEEKENLYIKESDSSKGILLGLAYRPDYHFMYVNPENKTPSYLMHGLGQGLFLNLDFSLNNFIRTEFNLGLKHFFVSTARENCGENEDCDIKVNYAVASGGLKLSMIKWDENQLWSAFEGALMYPFASRWTTSAEPKNIDGLHGTLGGALGIDLTFGNFVIPVSLRGALYMPSTATTIIGSAGAQIGLSYKF